MGKTAWLLFSIYLLIFVLFGIYFYFRMLNGYVTGTPTAKTQVQKISTNLYFSDSINLYRLDPEGINSLAADSMTKIHSNGLVENMDISRNNKYYAYDTQLIPKIASINVTEVSSKNTTQISAQANSVLSNFQEVSNPKFNFDSTKVAFIAHKDGRDAIWSQDLNNQSFSLLTLKTIGSITDFDWGNDADHLVYCFSEANSDGCRTLNLATQKEKQIITGKVDKISWTSTNQIFYLLQNGKQTDLYRIDSTGQNAKAITNVKDKKVTEFSFDSKDETIAFEVSAESVKSIYTVKADGTNLIQLFADGEAEQPLISPDGTSLAYVKTGDGIYVSLIDKSNERKIANVGNAKVKMLNWR